MEQYENKEALYQRQNSEYGKYYFPKMRALVEKIEVSFFECIVPLKSN